ncbi:hypothetical protein HALLA_04810 [Halostagnicola larsenii XH-48]|uniref:Uncharacterized protein n=1 Tax=Halostagnicola larsenii XH-48 TaxID=797299 RepID=W0JQ14_9EURY|nr:hypothetical protein [Halostagnicola larsenii]AHG00699.1 hypothetical protein HALLA_04810 [Halostagnicola larsenii XH-48]
MLSKRSLLRHALTVAGVGAIASGTAGAAPNARSTAEIGGEYGYDATAVADAGTTVTASVDRSILDITGVPEGVRAPFNDLRQQYSSVSLEDIGRVSASATLDGETITGGCAVATGSFDRRAIRTEAREYGLREVDSSGSEHRMETDANQRRVTGTGSSTTTTPTTDAPAATVDRLVADDVPYAIGVDDSTLYVGYGRGETDARTHVDAALETTGSGQSRSSETNAAASADYGSLPSLLSGHAVACASLDSATREALCDRLTDAPDSFRSAIEAARATGIALQAGSTQSRLRYGIVADPNRLSVDTVMDIVAEATSGSGSLENDGVYRDGWTFVLDATVETEELWAAHEQFLGSKSVDER